jgi:hypothetical protein
MAEVMRRAVDEYLGDDADPSTALAASAGGS